MESNERGLRLKSNLPTLLETRNLSIRELSRRVDHRLDSVRQLYHGTSVRLPVRLLERVCEELKCDLSDLLTLEPCEAKEPARDDA